MSWLMIILILLQNAPVAYANQDPNLDKMSLEQLVVEVDHKKAQIEQLKIYLTQMKRPANMAEAYGGYDVYLFTHFGEWIFRAISTGALVFGSIDGARALYSQLRAGFKSKRRNKLLNRAVRDEAQLEGLLQSGQYDQLFLETKVPLPSRPKIIEARELAEVLKFDEIELRELAAERQHHAFVGLATALIASAGWGIFRYLGKPKVDYVILTGAEKVQIEEALNTANHRLDVLKEALIKAQGRAAESQNPSLLQ